MVTTSTKNAVLVETGKWCSSRDMITTIAGRHPVHTENTWRTVESLDNLFPDPTLVKRLEFIRDDRRRGVFLIADDAEGTEREKVLAHLANALLGYDGSGPELSKAILEHLGVPVSVFEAIQDATRNDYPYVVVVRRLTEVPDSWDFERVR